jgi:hypothetical protein
VPLLTLCPLLRRYQVLLIVGVALSWGQVSSAEDPNAGAPAPVPQDPQAAQVQPQVPAQPAQAPAPAAAAQPAPASTGDKMVDSSKKEEEKKEEEPTYDFEHEDTFIDVPDALRSKQFVHRAILSTIIRDTAKVTLGNWYFDNTLGFNAVYQPANQGGESFAKYVTGVLGFAFGYVSQKGHAGELGFQFSGVSNLSLGYKYFMKPAKWSAWPFLGGGLTQAIVGIKLAEIPIEAQVYQGTNTGLYIDTGLVVPLVDIALKAQARFNFYGLDRLMLTTGVGVIFFL